jgi:hypothetical protein
MLIMRIFSAYSVLSVVHNLRVTRNCTGVVLWFGIVSILLLPGCRRSHATQDHATTGTIDHADVSAAIDPLAPISPARTPADRVVNRAKEEARRAVRYDASYQILPYPGGDVPQDRGACTDVVVRSLRATGIDLQRKIHEDMVARYDLYPHHWDNRRPDKNIDHRRGANHIVYFRRHARALPTGTTGIALSSWQPGDIVYWKLGNNLDHCGIISNVRNASGVPLVIHNIGIARQEDCLTSWKIVAHFRCQ